MATPLNIAFPPIVNAAIMAVIISPIQNISRLYVFDMVAVIVTPAEPDMIPHMSPITSLQNDDTLSAFFLNDTAVFAPFIFFELIAFNGLSVPDVTATPTMSNSIPIPINNSNIIILSSRFTFDNVISDISENMNDMQNAKMVIVISHLVLLFFFFAIIFLSYNKKG